MTDDVQKLAELQADILKIKSALRMEKARESQKKFLAKTAQEGKKRVAFFLSSAAIESLKKRKNEARKTTSEIVEALLLSAPVAQKVVEKEVEKIVMINELTDKQKAIFEQVQTMLNAYLLWDGMKKEASALRWKNETEKLAKLM